MQKESSAFGRFLRLIVVTGLLLLGWVDTFAQQLPIKIYTTADGLARDRVTRVRRDSRGFLWFCTEEGLSRFDGYGFTTYTTSDGLPSNNVRDFLETHDGDYWIATIGGLCRFNPYPRQPSTADGRQANRPDNQKGQPFIGFEIDNQNGVNFNALMEDRNGSVWCGTSKGVYRLQPDGSNWQLEQLTIEASVHVLIEDRAGRIWMATATGLSCRHPDGKIDIYTQAHGLPSTVIRGLLETGDGSIWVGTANGVCQLKTPLPESGSIVARVINRQQGLIGWGNWLAQSANGHIWVCCSEGLGELIPEGEDYRVKFYTTEQGLSGLFIWSIAEDLDKNLWITTNTGGVMKMARNGFTTWRKNEGLATDFVVGVSEDQSGGVCVTSMSLEGRYISRLEGESFKTIRPMFPPGIAEFGGEAQQDNLQDHTGEWWVATGSGLLRYPAVKSLEQLSRTPPRAHYTEKNGLFNNSVLRLFEDSRGDIWISSGIFNDVGKVVKWERKSETFRQYSTADNMPEGTASGFCEDRHGNVWIAFFSGNIVRYSNGQFMNFPFLKPILGKRLQHDIYCDREGRIWVGTAETGVVRIDHPQDDQPRFVNLTVNDGLSSNDVWDITEDNFGNIYLGTGRGLDRLNPQTGQIRHYTTADGLTSNYVLMVFRDRQGAIWTGTQKGVSRFQPEADLPLQPPPVFISRIQTAGEKHSISALGETHVAIADLEADQNKLTIDFFGLSLAVGESLRYQYKLEGTGSDWSEPSQQRNVDFANLKPGSYRFLVRAVSTDGSYSSESATVTFRILSPIWLRWWFIASSLLLVGSLAYLVFRSRLERKRERRQSEIALQLSKEERLYELEQVRRRIATDLHDDVGSSLTQISLLTEVVRQRVNGKENTANEQLTLIGRISRELVDSMSDIVWSINPAKDTLSDLSQRMRLFASDVLTAKQIQFTFQAPDENRDMKIGTNMRREIFLAFKEGINNVARHSGCNAAEIEFQMGPEQLTVEITDNGRGFDTSRNGDGNGLSSMSERVRTLGGEFEIHSRAGEGTTLRFVIPLHQEITKFR